MLRKKERWSPVLVQYAAMAIALLGAAAAGHVLTVTLTPEPEPITHFIATNTPPCVADLIESGRDERAHRDTADQHDALAGERASERYDAERTRDEDTIAEAARRLDAELELVQQAELDTAEAVAAFETAAEQCEADR
ncbi:hypothetical protein C8K30_1011077 [Promicromonospora sp. AC04]|uniref:hypothetical protein n=1 Tax=Promicromonospora sp. AC04 TaxID=2135723 RepID=UPI000D33A55E|nr:hypothetical protein [Promicromonospora sp. AC04]PUB32551.1 hypothetical protein C8K30_1011077 [Promicromonospora sp. AC04]